jgi:hypothetical protein
MKLGASILSVVGAYYSLVVSLVFSFSVMRRFPAEELATYTVLNAGFSMASVMLGYATVWYPLYLLNSRERYAEPAGVGIVIFAEVVLFCDIRNRVWYVAVLATGSCAHYTLPGRLTHTSPCTSEDVATLDYVAQT